MAKNARLVFMGTPAFAVTILNGLLESGYEVPLVITQPDQPSGRRKRSAPSPVAEAASSRHITVVKPAAIAAAAREVTEVIPDVLVVAAYGQILPAEVLTLAPYGALNVHASLLPAYRGASPIQHAILDGKSETGVTIMQMDQGLDTGPILTQSQVPISETATAGSLSETLATRGVELLVETLPQVLDGSMVPRAQDEASASVTPLLRKGDGLVDWQQPAEQILRHVRAMQPWPGATAQHSSGSIQIMESGIPGDQPDTALKPGGFVEQAREVIVGTGTAPIRLIRVQPAGKQSMAALDWLKGYREDRQFNL